MSIESFSLKFYYVIDQRKSKSNVVVVDWATLFNWIGINWIDLIFLIDVSRFKEWNVLVFGTAFCAGRQHRPTSRAIWPVRTMYSTGLTSWWVLYYFYLVQIRHRNLLFLKLMATGRILLCRAFSQPAYSIYALSDDRAPFPPFPCLDGRPVKAWSNGHLGAFGSRVVSFTSLLYPPHKRLSFFFHPLTWCLASHNDVFESTLMSILLWAGKKSRPSSFLLLKE